MGDAPFRGPHGGDGVTAEDRATAEFRFRKRIREIRRQGRTTLTEYEYGNSNSTCNCGYMDYATRNRILREEGISLPR
jgi:hypothetical protein